MAVQSQPRKPVVQESDGIGGQTSPQISLFVPKGSHLRCQANALGDTIAVSLTLAYHGHISFHGTVADIARMVELMRTTLEEYASEQTE